MTTTQYTFDNDTISCFHKDATGFRPGSAFWEFWANATDAEKQAEWDSLGVAFDRREAMIVEEEKRCIAEFEHAVKQVIEAGAGTRGRAIEWLMDGQDIDVRGDVGFFEYLMGIPYGYVKKTGV